MGKIIDTVMEMAVASSIWVVMFMSIPVIEWAYDGWYRYVSLVAVGILVGSAHSRIMRWFGYD